jgi:hypothetical protein
MMEVTMVRTKLAAMLGMLGLLAGLSGCGGASGMRTGPSAPRAPSSGESSKSGSARPPGDADFGSGGGSVDVQGAEDRPPPAPPSGAAAPASESRSGALRAETQAPPRERRGLGTEWGEARSSRVHDVVFVREAGAPFATAMLNYNDRRGVDAMASREGRPNRFRDVPAGGGAVSISIRDESGDPLEALKLAGRTFVIGESGQRYTIVLTNKTSHRFEAVTTVDGLDVVNGKSGSFENRGYVLQPFATVEIEGFRQSASSVAAFRFAAVKDSYAAQVGSARNVGVIGVALFGERGDAFVPESELRLREEASPFPADPRFAPPPPRR